MIRGIYRILDRLGFRGGSVLEPALGVGHFIGLLPEEWMPNTRWTGIELDPTTARIAQALYPECDIRIQGFEEAMIEDDSYDLVVSNVPFGRYPVNDPVHNLLGFRIHDYFFTRALAAVRPGGVVAMLTSRYTLDKRSSRVREYLAQRADLVGAVRLPNTAFLANEYFARARPLPPALAFAFGLGRSEFDFDQTPAFDPTDPERPRVRFRPTQSDVKW